MTYAHRKYADFRIVRQGETIYSMGQIITQLEEIGKFVVRVPLWGVMVGGVPCNGCALDEAGDETNGLLAAIVTYYRVSPRGGCPIDR